MYFFCFLLFWESFNKLEHRNHASDSGGVFSKMYLSSLGLQSNRNVKMSHVWLLTDSPRSYHICQGTVQERWAWWYTSWLWFLTTLHKSFFLLSISESYFILLLKVTIMKTPGLIKNKNKKHNKKHMPDFFFFSFVCVCGQMYFYALSVQFGQSLRKHRTHNSQSCYVWGCVCAPRWHLLTKSWNKVQHIHCSQNLTMCKEIN